MRKEKKNRCAYTSDVSRCRKKENYKLKRRYEEEEKNMQERSKKWRFEDLKILIRKRYEDEEEKFKTEDKDLKEKKMKSFNSQDKEENEVK